MILLWSEHRLLTPFFTQFPIKNPSPCKTEWDSQSNYLIAIDDFQESPFVINLKHEMTTSTCQSVNV